jgi:hypothetical protein
MYRDICFGLVPIRYDDIVRQWGLPGFARHGARQPRYVPAASR